MSSVSRNCGPRIDTAVVRGPAAAPRNEPPHFGRFFEEYRASHGWVTNLRRARGEGVATVKLFTTYEAERLQQVGIRLAAVLNAALRSEP